MGTGAGGFHTGPALARAREAARRSSCANNLKQWALVLKMFANESQGNAFPTVGSGYKTSANIPAGAVKFNFGVDAQAVYPEYLSDVNIAQCPSSKSASLGDQNFFKNSNGNACSPIDPVGHGGRCYNAWDESYTYYGWLFDRVGDEHPSKTMATLAALYAPLGSDGPLATDTGPTQFVTAFEKILQTALPLLGSPTPANLAAVNAIFASPLNVGAPHGNGQGANVQRLREGIEPFLITDINNAAGSAKAQSNIWIMTDLLATNIAAFNHVPGGCNILFMDGHSAFIKYPGEMPVGKNMAAAGGGLSRGTTF